MIDSNALLARFTAPPHPSDKYARARWVRREKVARGAIRTGRDPRGEYDAEALAELFSEEELAELIEAAEERRLERLTVAEALERRKDLEAMVRQIRRERAEAERAEIDAEARRRLGVDRGGLPIEE